MKTHNSEIQIDTKEYLQFFDITEDVKKITEESKIKNGLVNVQTKHTTAVMFLNENEPLLLEDMKDHIEKIAPITNNYRHDNFEIRTVNMCDNECDNGHSHCKALHFPSSITLNLIDGKIQFGRWQRVMFIELDRPRPRMISVNVMGI